MRILDVGPWIAYPPERGPAVRAFTLLRLLADRHDVRQFGRGSTRLRPGERMLEEVPVTPMFRVYRSRYPLGRAAAERLVARGARGGVVDAVARRIACPQRLRELLAWANVTVAEDPVELALCRGEQPAGRYVFVAHEVGQLSSVSRDGYDRVAEAVETAELTIATSPLDREELLARYELDAERVVEVPNAVDTELHRPPQEGEPARLRAELGLPPGPLAVFVGSATPANRAALAWLRRLAEHSGRVTYVVVGDVAAPARRGNLILTGRVRETAPYLRAADLAVCPVEHATGTRIKVWEALATGLPAVVFPECLRGTDLVDGVHVAVAAKSEHALLEAIEGLLDEPERAAGLGAAGRALALERHDARRAAAILERALLELLGTAPPARNGREPHAA